MQLGWYSDLLRDQPQCMQPLFLVVDLGALLLICIDSIILLSSGFVRKRWRIVTSKYGGRARAWTRMPWETAPRVWTRVVKCSARSSRLSRSGRNCAELHQRTSVHMLSTWSGTQFLSAHTFLFLHVEPAVGYFEPSHLCPCLRTTNQFRGHDSSSLPYEPTGKLMDAMEIRRAPEINNMQERLDA